MNQYTIILDKPVFDELGELLAELINNYHSGYIRISQFDRNRLLTAYNEMARANKQDDIPSINNNR